MNPPPQFSEREIRQQALEWLTRLKSGDCCETEKRAFAVWLAQHPAHQIAYRNVEHFWGQLDGLGNVADSQMQAARRYLHHAKTSRRRKPVLPWTFALGVAVLLVLSPLGRHWVSSDHYQTVKGERRSVQLSDGSSIELNTDTELRISYALGHRTVWLEHGEAWFSVVHDAGHPFEVRAGDGWIRDIGTQFNVYREGEHVSVAVQEGEVSICTEQTKQALNLTAGRQTVYDDSGRLNEVEQSDLNSITAWRSGLLIFKKQPLQAVLQQLSRYHNVSVNVFDPKLKDLSVSGRFPANDLNQTLNTIASALSVKVMQEGAERLVIRREN